MFLVKTEKKKILISIFFFGVDFFLVWAKKCHQGVEKNCPKLEQTPLPPINSDFDATICIFFEILFYFGEKMQRILRISFPHQHHHHRNTNPISLHFHHTITSPSHLYHTLIIHHHPHLNLNHNPLCRAPVHF